MNSWDYMVKDAVDHTMSKDNAKDWDNKMAHIDDKKCDDKKAHLDTKKCKDKKICRKASVEVDNLSSCVSQYVYPHATHVPIIKVPVVLTEEEIQVDIESHIKFEEPISEVKRVKKNVYIEQCKVIVTKYHPYCSKGKMFISGYVRKNIEYATLDCKAKNISSGDIKHLTVKVPFRCVAEISFRIAQPVMSWPYTQDQYEVLGEDCICKCDKVKMGKKECEDIFINKEDMMESIFCEFEGAKLIVVDLHEDMDSNEEFTELTEKMIAYIKVKVLQKQQVKGFEGYIPLMDEKEEDDEELQCSETDEDY